MSKHPKPTVDIPEYLERQKDNPRVYDGTIKALAKSQPRAAKLFDELTAPQLTPAAKKALLLGTDANVPAPKRPRAKRKSEEWDLEDNQKQFSKNLDLLAHPENLPHDWELEDLHQATLILWKRIQVFTKPEYADLHYLHSVPNGGFRTVKTAKKLKATGAMRGVFDLFLDIPKGEHHGLRIELKAGDGKPSKEQKQWLEFYTRQGYRALILTGWEAARDAIIQYLKGTHHDSDPRETHPHDRPQPEPD